MKQHPIYLTRPQITNLQRLLELLRDGGAPSLSTIGEAELEVVIFALTMGAVAADIRGDTP